jgi:hypothetical protein
MATVKATTKQRQSQQRQQRRLSVINLAETIAAEDIVVPATLPMGPQLPHPDTLFRIMLFRGREVGNFYYTWEYIENLDET